MSDFEKSLYEKLGIRIKLMRKSRNMKQGDLAKKMGISQANVAQYEKGTRKMSIETLRVLSEIFDCTMDDLLGTSFGNKIIDENHEYRLYELLQISELSDDDFKNILDYVEFYLSKKVEPRISSLNNTIFTSKKISEERNKKRSSPLQNAGLDIEK